MDAESAEISIPTPDISHLKATDYDRIYEPSEDTFVLLDGLELDYKNIISNRPRIVYEIGSGSGCVSTFIASILKSSCLYLSSDINLYANKCTNKTGLVNGYNLDVINTNLLDGIRLYKSIDILIFNPPYVPTYTEEVILSQSSKHLSSAWSGGNYGMDLTNKVLSDLDRLLSHNGVLYLVAIKQNNPIKIVDDLNSTGLFNASILLKRRAGIELLFIIKCCRISPS